MKRILKTAAVLSVALAAGESCSGGEYTLLKSDDSTHRSFLTNPGEGYGWSSGEDPAPGNTYILNEGRNLYTPTGEGGETLRFPGDRLTIDYGNFYLYAGSSAAPYKEVVVDDLLVSYGDISTCASFRGYEFRLNGSITIDTSKTSYNSRMVRMLALAGDRLFVLSDIIASEQETIIYRGAYELYSRISDLFDENGNKQFGWKTYYNKMQIHLCGDNSRNFSTNRIMCANGFYIGCPVLPGAIVMENTSLVSMDSSVEKTSVGPVFSRDGSLVVPAGKSLSAASLDFAFAPPSTYMLRGTNIYTSLDASVPYEPSNTASLRYGSETCYLNTVGLEAGARLSAPSAKLSGTLIRTGNSAVFTVGDAELTDVTLSGTGLLQITNSLALAGKIRIAPDTSALEATLLTLPVGKGELDADDFAVRDGLNPYQYRLFVTTENGLQLLRCRNLYCGTFDESTGYVYGTQAGGSGYLGRATNWSDGQAPHSGTNYYVGNKLSTFNCDAGGVFQGDSVTLGRYVYDLNRTRIRAPDRTCVTEIADLILSPYCEGIVAWYDKAITTYRGRMTFLNTAELPFRFFGEQSGQAYVVESELCGWTNAVIEAFFRGTPSSLEPGMGEPRLDFVGTHSNYHGLFRIGTNELVRLGGDGFPNAEIEILTRYTKLQTYPETGGDFPVGRLSLSDSEGYLETSEDTTLRVGALELSGLLKKSGTGRLVVGGTALSGSGAGLMISAGSLMAASETAFTGTEVTLTEDSELVVAYPDGSPLVAENAVLPDVLDVTIEADEQVLRSDRPTVPFLTIPTPDSAPSFRIRKPCSGCCFTVVTSVSDGKTTYSAKFTQPGFAISFR